MRINRGNAPTNLPRRGIPLPCFVTLLTALSGLASFLVFDEDVWFKSPGAARLRGRRLVGVTQMDETMERGRTPRLAHDGVTSPTKSLGRWSRRDLERGKSVAELIFLGWGNHEMKRFKGWYIGKYRNSTDGRTHMKGGRTDFVESLGRLGTFV